MLLELRTKEFIEPQLISYSPRRPVLRGTFPPLALQTSQAYILLSEQPHLYNDLQFTFTYITSSGPK